MRQILLVTTQGLKDRKTFGHKMCNLYKVSLPHKLLHSNNSGSKQVFKVLPCCLQCDVMSILVSTLLFYTVVEHSVMVSARGCPGSTCISPVWLERCKLSLSLSLSLSLF